jgi:hypothetical protein
MDRGKDPGNLANFLPLLIKAKDDLYGGNVKGGLVAYRRYELTNELDALNKDLISKILKRKGITTKSQLP